MTKRFNILSLSAALCAILAATAAYALSGAPKTATVPTHTAVSKTVPASTLAAHLTSKQDDDGKEKDDGKGKDDEKDTPDPTSATLTPAQAADAALAAYPGGTVAGTPALEDEDGVAVYEVHVTAADGKKYDVKVDANTGKVLKSDADDNDDKDGDGGPDDGPNDGPDGT